MEEEEEHRSVYAGSTEVAAYPVVGDCAMRHFHTPFPLEPLRQEELGYERVESVAVRPVVLGYTHRCCHYCCDRGQCLS